MSRQPERKTKVKGDNYKEIYLDYHGHPQAITPQAYEQIVAIIKAHLICKHCLRGYTQENPQVNDRIDQDIRATLLHYGYRVPDRYTTKSGKEVDLNAH